MQCPFCKNETSSIMNFCESCGKDLSQENKTKDAIDIKSRMIHQIIVWSVALIVIGVLSLMVAPFIIGQIAGCSVMAVGLFGLILRKRFMFMVIGIILLLFVAIYVFVSVIMRSQFGLIGFVIILPIAIYGVLNIRRYFTSKEIFKIQ